MTVHPALLASLLCPSLLVSTHLAQAQGVVTYDNILLPSHNAQIHNGSGIVTNQNGSKIGSIDEYGTIKNIYGISTGYISPDGTIQNNSNIKIGSINPDGHINTPYGSPLGSINDNGDVYDRNGWPIGSIDQEGNVHDSHGVRIAQTPSRALGALMLLNLIILDPNREADE